MTQTATKHPTDLAADGFVTVKAAAAHLCLSVASLYVLMDRGELSYAKFGRSRRIPRRALAEYANKNTVAASN